MFHMLFTFACFGVSVLSGSFISSCHVHMCPRHKARLIPGRRRPRDTGDAFVGNSAPALGHSDLSVCRSSYMRCALATRFCKLCYVASSFAATQYPSVSICHGPVVSHCIHKPCCLAGRHAFLQPSGSCRMCTCAFVQLIHLTRRTVMVGSQHFSQKARKPETATAVLACLYILSVVSQSASLLALSHIT